MKFMRYLSLCLLCFCSSIFGAPVKLTGLHLTIDQQYHFSFKMSGKTNFAAFTLKHPNRLVVDFHNSVQAFTPKPAIFANTPIKTMRIATRKHHGLRIVFDLKLPCKTTTQLLNPKNRRGYRTVVSFLPSKTSKHLAPLKKSPTPANPKPKPVEKKLRKIVIVLDPGHGGRDPGATGPRGTHEKKITLAIGLDVRRDLRKISGLKIDMTRTKDVYPSLSQRLYLARRVKADVFVSIHADAFKNRAARGATVFALSQGRATSVAGRWIAEQENKSELLGGVDLADKSYTLRSVLVDLSQTATIGSSLKLGRNVVNNLRSITRLHSKRVEQASLYVLTSPDIPAILVETGFISNPTEERLLNTPSYQKKIANAISHGIKKYLIDNPIQNTLFTARIFGGKYIVKNGDTLSGIAAKFGVDQQRLRAVNVVNKGKIFVGQVIRIPAKARS
jgi:N-acetylmuramoyl-L-alanine amidase